MELWTTSFVHYMDLIISPRKPTKPPLCKIPFFHVSSFPLRTMYCSIFSPLNCMILVIKLLVPLIFYVLFHIFFVRYSNIFTFTIKVQLELLLKKKKIAKKILQVQILTFSKKKKKKIQILFKTL